MATTVDERGRVLIPRRVRRAHGLTPGSPVIIESSPEGVLLRAALPKDRALRLLAGAISNRRRRGRAKAQGPLDIKRIWEPTV